LFIAPLAGMVPAYATAPVLLLVGASMFKSVSTIDFRKIEEGLPAFLTIILIPLTFSITQGILWGFISHVGLYLVVGRRREIHPVMFVLALIAIGLLVLEHSNVSKAFYE
jgi:AGZA family xanthine/uracil permease-like MFS transporter